MSKLEKALLEARDTIKQSIDIENYVSESKLAKKKLDEALVKVVREILKEND